MTWGRAARWGAIAVVGGALWVVVRPLLASFETFGFHDWDIALAYRYATVIALRHGEGPWWNPWLCGGAPAWGYPEGAPNLISPYLPLYLLADLRVALRLEVVGQAVLGLVGTALVAGRFTRSAALRALCAVLFVLNGRWSLQAAVGHTWHLQYALMPWALYFFDRALDERRLRDAVWAAVPLALMCYWGGVYPLPHTALLLACYALLRAAFERSRWPLLALATTGAAAFGFAAPKLFAVVDFMRRAPRAIASDEAIGLRQLYVMLTDRSQRYRSLPIPVPAYRWHEWGIYVGFGGLLCLGAGLVVARGARGRALALTGALCLVLGLGAFASFAPWTLLHRLPPFASQHVPSRFLYPMILFLGLAFAAAAARWVDPLVERRPWADALLLLPVALVAADIAHVSRVPFTEAFWMRKPDLIQPLALFEHRTNPPLRYKRPDWAPPMLLAMMANTGVIACYGLDPSFVPAAVAADDPRYRGRAFVAAGAGEAEVVGWSPNAARVRVRGAAPGALVVYDMNDDPSWRADGARAISQDGLVAGPLAPGAEEIAFRYRPRSLRWSLPIFVLTLVACLTPPLGRRRRAARASRSRAGQPQA